MRLNKTTGHAIRILIDCARAKDQRVKVADLAERLGIARQNAFKIVNNLAHAGFLVALRGRNGGVRLARPAAEIRIGDVVRATEVTVMEVKEASAGQTGAATRGSSGINHILDSALEAFISVLDEHTLADMVAAHRPARAASGANSKPPRTSAKIAITGRVRRRRAPLSDNLR